MIGRVFYFCVLFEVSGKDVYSYYNKPVYGKHPYVVFLHLSTVGVITCFNDIHV